MQFKFNIFIMLVIYDLNPPAQAPNAISNRFVIQMQLQILMIVRVEFDFL